MGCYPAALTRCVVTWNKKLDTHHCTTQKINALFPKDGILYMLLQNCSRIFLYATLPFYNKDFLLTFLQFFFYERWQASCYDIRYCISTKYLKVVWYICRNIFYHQILESFWYPSLIALQFILRFSMIFII